MNIKKFIRTGYVVLNPYRMQRWLPVPMGFVVLLLSSTEGWSFPPCPTDRYASTWTNCIGNYPYASGGGYVGEWKNGYYHGKGTYTFTNGDKYVGSVSENAMHGKGKMIFVKGGHYMGYFSKNQFHGEGVLATPGKVLAGNWDNGIFVD